MYLSDSSDQLFAYKCENNNSCPFKVMTGKITDFNFNSHRCRPKKTGQLRLFPRLFLVSEGCDCDRGKDGRQRFQWRGAERRSPSAPEQVPHENPGKSRRHIRHLRY
jgi:hypothetical protein